MDGVGNDYWRWDCIAMGQHGDMPAWGWEGRVMEGVVQHGIPIVKARTVAGHNQVLLATGTPICHVKGGGSRHSILPKERLYIHNQSLTPQVGSIRSDRQINKERTLGFR